MSVTIALFGILDHDVGTCSGPYSDKGHFLQIRSRLAASLDIADVLEIHKSLPWTIKTIISLAS